MRRTLIAGAAALAACGVLGMAPAAVQASPAAALTWTRQHPPVHPITRQFASVAYDAATRTIVLFGGNGHNVGRLADTWTWNGATWTPQHPAASPSARVLASMAYDAGTGTAVLFGSDSPWRMTDTWTWG